jgi:DNA-3-methyladenine glycosylase II
MKNWEKAEDFLKVDKYIGPLVKKYGHCKIKPRIHVDYFQGLVGEIIGQQLSGRVADVIYSRLKKKVKGRITPEKILALSDQQLRGCGMAWAKVRSIKDLARRVKEKKLQIKKLNILPDDEVIRELVAVKGIGRWTAEMFLMFSLGRVDVFTNDDLGIRKGFVKVIGKNLDGEKMGRFARRWKPYRTVASWYIWLSLENK